MATAQPRQPAFRPWCCKCGRPVDYMDWNYNVLTRNYEVAMLCHGQSYIKEISVLELEMQDVPYVMIFRAFTPADGFPVPLPKPIKRVLTL